MRSTVNETGCITCPSGCSLEEEIDLPGWTPDMVDEITEIYELDVDRIAQMPGVRLITP